MDSIEFHEILSANIGKLCSVTLKDGSEHQGINNGVSHDGFGVLYVRLENKGHIESFSHTQVQHIDIKE